MCDHKTITTQWQRIDSETLANLIRLAAEGAIYHGSFTDKALISDIQSNLDNGQYDIPDPVPVNTDTPTDAYRLSCALTGTRPSVDWRSSNVRRTSTRTNW